MIGFRHKKKVKKVIVSIVTLQLVIATFVYISIRTSNVKLTLYKAPSTLIVRSTLKENYEAKSQVLDEEQSSGNIVVYNRVPKCASTTTRKLFNTLRRFFPQRFSLRVESYPKIKQVLDETEQKSLAEKWNSAAPRTVFIRHLHFLDFTKYNLSQPVYINIIRDPVEQFISGYYFMRFGFEGWSNATVKKWLGLKPDEQRYMSLEECVVQNVTKCVRQNPSKILGYFCGHENKCRESNRWSLNKAKENVERYFAMVGIVEEYDNTLKLLQAVIPRYFTNVFRVYQQMKNNGKLPPTKTARKKNPPSFVKDQLRKELQNEVEFYDYVKNRFHQQLKEHKITTDIT